MGKSFEQGGHGIPDVVDDPIEVVAGCFQIQFPVRDGFLNIEHGFGFLIAHFVKQRNFSPEMFTDVLLVIYSYGHGQIDRLQ